MRFGVSTRAAFEGCRKGQDVFLLCCQVPSGDAQDHPDCLSIFWKAAKKVVGSVYFCTWVQKQQLWGVTSVLSAVASLACDSS